MPAPRKYDQETRDRAVRMYRERRQAHPAESAIESRRQVGALIESSLHKSAESKAILEELTETTDPTAQDA